MRTDEVGLRTPRTVCRCRARRPVQLLLRFHTFAILAGNPVGLLSVCPFRIDKRLEQEPPSSVAYWESCL